MDSPSSSISLHTRQAIHLNEIILNFPGLIFQYQVVCLFNKSVTLGHNPKLDRDHYVRSVSLTDEPVTLTIPNLLHKSQQVFPAGRPVCPAL